MPAEFNPRVLERTFTAGRVISRAFSVWAKNLPTLLVLGLLVNSPLILWGALALAPGQPQEPTQAALMAPLSMLLNFVLVGGVTFTVLQQLKGERASIGQAVAVGLRRVFPVLWLAILAGLATMGAFLLLVVPGLIVMCMLWVAVPVAVVEKPGAVASMRRSRELTRGFRWHVLGAMAVMALVGAGAQGIVNVALSAATSEVGVWLGFAVSQVISSLTGALGAVAPAVGYHDLRVTKEGVDTESLLRVFE